MLKTEIRELLNHGHELEWEWNSLCFSLLPVWDDPNDQYHVHNTKADFCVVDNEKTIVDKIYNSLDEIISEGYDLETMCDDSNPTFSY